MPRYILSCFVVQGTMSPHSWSYVASVPRRLLPPQHSGVAAHVLWAQVPVGPSWIFEWLCGDPLISSHNSSDSVSSLVKTDQVPILPAPKSTASRGCEPRPVRACFHLYLSSVFSLSKAAAPSVSSSALCCSRRLLSQVRSSQLTCQGLSWQVSYP